MWPSVNVIHHEPAFNTINLRSTSSAESGNLFYVFRYLRAPAFHPVLDISLNRLTSVQGDSSCTPVINLTLMPITIMIVTIGVWFLICVVRWYERVCRDPGRRGLKYTFLITQRGIPFDGIG